MRDTPSPRLEYKTHTYNQFDAQTVDDCVWYAVNDAYEEKTRGAHYSTNPEMLRKKHTGGISGPSKLSNVLAAFAKEWPGAVHYDQSPSFPLSTQGAIEALQRGATLVVLGDYEQLPKYYRRWTFNDTFDHAVVVRTFNPSVRLSTGSAGSTWFYDPLGGGNSGSAYSGEWIAVESVFNDYAWRTNGAVSAGIIDHATEANMFTVDNDQKTPRVAQLKKGTKFRKQPSMAGAIAYTLNLDKSFPYLGKEADEWHIVLSKVPNLVALKGVYIHTNDIIKIEDVPQVPTDPELIAENARLKAENLSVSTRLDTANNRIRNIDKEAVPA